MISAGDIGQAHGDPNRVHPFRGDVNTVWVRSISRLRVFRPVGTDSGIARPFTGRTVETNNFCARGLVSARANQVLAPHPAGRRSSTRKLQAPMVQPADISQTWSTKFVLIVWLVLIV